MSEDNDDCLILPNSCSFSAKANVTKIFVDFGGSLIKVAYFELTPRIRLSSLGAFSTDNDVSKSEQSNFNTDNQKFGRALVKPKVLGGRLKFKKFETKKLPEFKEFLAQLFERGKGSIEYITVTGGGAQKYSRILEEELGISVSQADEIDCLVTGCNFLLREIHDEAFTYHAEQAVKYQFQRISDRRFPYLLVIIGSGVSIIKVTGEHEYERIGGSSLGGGTFWGLACLLTETDSFDNTLSKSLSGESKNVDMTVGDIYEGDYNKIGLNADITASSFGKAMRTTPGNKNFKEEDISQGLLEMISNNIGQIAYLYSQIHNLSHIYFGGYFIRNHEHTMNAMTNAVNFWSKGETKALFLRHEGFLGVVGAFQKSAKLDASSSWDENFVCDNYSWLNPVGLDKSFEKYSRFPLLDSKHTYTPDSFNLTENSALTEYWLRWLKKSSDKLISQCVEFEGDTESSKNRATIFNEHMDNLLQTLKENPNAYGKLSVRALFDLQLQCLGDSKFEVDSYHTIKQKENAAALKQLPHILSEYRSMTYERRQLCLIEGILAGNMFDWGAPEVEKLMVNGQLDFNGARSKLQTPWFINSVDKWLERIKNGIPYKKAVLFVDNSGADIILGILPFALELVSGGTKVVIACNTWPALNDVTFREMMNLKKELHKIDKTLSSALTKEDIVFMPTGSDNVGLDLYRVETKLTDCCRDVDLVVLEGMGRSIHTNFYAKFTCDSLKLASLKSELVASLLGGKLYDIVCDFEGVETTET